MLSLQELDSESGQLAGGGRVGAEPSQGYQPVQASAKEPRA